MGLHGFRAVNVRLWLLQGGLHPVTPAPERRYNAVGHEETIAKLEQLIEFQQALMATLVATNAILEAIEQNTGSP